jgi:hypothetical protein
LATSFLKLDTSRPDDKVLLDRLNATKYVHAEDFGLRQAAREQDKIKDDHQG